MRILNLIESEFTEKIQCAVLPFCDTPMTYNVQVIKSGLIGSSAIDATIMHRFARPL